MARATNLTDRFAAACAVADALLYEGDVLYPYRAQAQKNQLRRQFGVLAPPAWAAADPSERCVARTECLLAPGGRPSLAVRVRCLQVQRRSIKAVGDVAEVSPALVPWDEAVEHVVEVPVQALSPLVTASRVEQFRFPPADSRELAHSSAGAAIAHIVRRREPVNGRITVGVCPADDFSGLLKVIVTVENATAADVAGDRDAMLRQSLVAVHTMLTVDDGCFVSLLEPPPHAQLAAGRCRNEGTFPVLVGPDDDIVLSSPILLYDHPTVATESPGDRYDANEVDEIPALRVVTLTDAEIVEVRGTDRPRAVPWWDPGVDASVDPDTDSVRVGDVDVAKGSRVRLQPTRRVDAQDLFLADQEAIVAAVFRDVDGGDHIAVVLATDPNADLAGAQGRYLYFAPDEVEPLDERRTTT